MPTGGFFGGGGWSGSTGSTGTRGTGVRLANMPSDQPSDPYSLPSYQLPQSKAPGVDQTQAAAGAIQTAGRTAQKVVTDQQASFASPFLLQQLGQGLYGPQQTLLDQQLQNQQSALGLVGLNVDQQKSALTTNSALAQRKLDLERGLTGGQLGNLDKLKALLGETKANQGAGISTSARDVRDQAKRKTWDLRSNLTSRGAFSTIANERGTGRIARDLSTQLQGLHQQRVASDISYRQGMTGYDNQALQLQNRLAGIGLDSQDITNRMQQGLAQIGLSGYTDMNSLMQSINGTNQQQAAVAQQILTFTLTNSGLPADVVQSIIDAMRGPGPAPAASQQTNTQQKSGRFGL